MPMQIRGTASPNTPPSGLVERQLSVEMGSSPPKLWCGVPTSIDASGRVQLSPPADYVSTAAQAPFVSIVSYGGRGDGVTDNTAALLAALAVATATGRGIAFPAGRFVFNSAVIFTLPHNLASITIVGAGADATVIERRGVGDGWRFNLVDQANSVHIRDLSIVTDQVTGGTGLYLSLAYSVNPALVGQSDISRVSFYGMPSLTSVTRGWLTAIYVFGVSLIVFDTILVCGFPSFEGGASNTTGVSIEGNSPTTIPVVANFQNCNFVYLDLAVRYGPWLQGMTFVACDFTGVGRALYAPSLAPGLFQLAVTNSQFNCHDAAIEMASPLPSMMIANNLIIVGELNPGTGPRFGIISRNPDLLTITGNTFWGAGSDCTGIHIDPNLGAGDCSVVGNSFSGFGVGINIVSPHPNPYDNPRVNLAANSFRVTQFPVVGMPDAVEIYGDLNIAGRATAHGPLQVTSTPNALMTFLVPAIKQWSVGSVGPDFRIFNDSDNRLALIFSGANSNAAFGGGAGFPGPVDTQNLHVFGTNLATPGLQVDQNGGQVIFNTGSTGLIGLYGATQVYTGGADIFTVRCQSGAGGGPARTRYLVDGVSLWTFGSAVTNAAGIWQGDQSVGATAYILCPFGQAVQFPQGSGILVTNQINTTGTNSGVGIYDRAAPGNPANQWTVYASGGGFYFFTGGQNTHQFNGAGGAARLSGAGPWDAISDRRVKRGIAKYRRGLADVLQLDPISFAYNGKSGTLNNGRVYQGLDADDAIAVMPELETTQDWGGQFDGVKILNHNPVTWALVNAVKELHAELAELKAMMRSKG